MTDHQCESKRYHELALDVAVVMSKRGQHVPSLMGIERILETAAEVTARAATHAARFTPSARKRR